MNECVILVPTFTNELVNDIYSTHLIVVGVGSAVGVKMTFSARIKQSKKRWICQFWPHLHAKVHYLEQDWEQISFLIQTVSFVLVVRRQKMHAR